jgi:DNA-binding MarR family transcriptional regulator
MSEPSASAPQDTLLYLLRTAILAELHTDQADLNLRQLAATLTVYLTDEPQTVRGLAEQLQVPKSSITRALDRLAELNLVRRKVDPADRRSVIAQRTATGRAMVERLKAAMTAAD